MIVCLRTALGLGLDCAIVGANAGREQMRIASDTEGRRGPVDRCK